MRKSNTSRRPALRVVERSTDWVPLAKLEEEVAEWVRAGRREGFSEGTLDNHRLVGAKLVWFLREKGYRRCGPEEVTAFLDHLVTGHMEGGRFEQRATTPLKPSTLAFYFTNLRAFFNRLLGLGQISEHPMRKLSRPRVREDQIEPFSVEQVQAIMQAAKNSRDPVRNEALLLLLYDTGIRASELCGLTIGDVDILNQRLTVHGKGGKKRVLYLGEQARRAMKRLIDEYRSPAAPEEPAEKTQPVFCSNRGRTAGSALTRGGVHLLVASLGKVAGVEQVRCSPHTFRHSFAISYLRDGGQPFSLQEIMGHHDLGQTRRYTKLADADLAEQHARHSPADRLFGRRKGKR